MKHRKQWANDWHKTMHSPVTLATPGPELERFEVPDWPEAWRCSDAPSATHALASALVVALYNSFLRAEHGFTAVGIQPSALKTPRSSRPNVAKTPRLSSQGLSNTKNIKTLRSPAQSPKNQDPALASATDFRHSSNHILLKKACPDTYWALPKPLQR